MNSEVVADVLVCLVGAIADDMLTGQNSGVEEIYTAYVKQLAIEEGSY
jgi:hypothetical protein